MDKIKILAYSDIHHHQYGNGITEDDVMAVEEEFMALRQLYQPDLIIFGGDLFESRNPLDYIRYNAYKSIIDHYRLCNTDDARVVYLVGNHDRSTKSHVSHHVYRHAKLHNLFPMVRIIDTTEYIRITTKDGNRVNILGIPADHNASSIDLLHSHSALNMCIFHNMVGGSTLQNGLTIPGDALKTELDAKHFDLVLGGDNHMHQRLDFKNTIGYYIGAPMQHNWGDTGAKRGFMYIEVIIRADNSKCIHVEHIESRAPKFVKFEWRLDSIAQIQELVEQNKGSLNKNIIKIKMSGRPEVFNNVTPNELATKIKLAALSRQIKVSFEFDQIDIEPPVNTHNTDADVWDVYLSSKGQSLKDIDIKELSELGKTYLND